ncbi:unnamed protein product [Tilletia laevis]|uniref:Tetraspanin Tsp2 n=2 Tax=Tilletia TaxID=13289 RepID=A0A177VC54_9BASI|nr:hypothetical protein CF336_g5559 [Tilletia laevis]KAE8256817.1 hypothetical protein A4X03_0g5027 [Tilletia caries]KAE8195902.1 hypothetical protein CF335_g4984 [Tilletia laevis]CAD6888041.1 unnamed protein product [Tilletia caries]CAD6937302.1 unnamed protein product [Tilletia caries]
MDGREPSSHSSLPHQATQQFPRPILHSSSGPAAMDRSMGTRQSVVTFADAPSVIENYGGVPELLNPSVHHGGYFPHEHLQNHQGLTASNAGSAPLSPMSGVNDRPTSLLSAASASSALSELSESLRWAQKFPEGKHLSRARSSVVSLGLKDKDKSMGGGGGGGGEVEIMPTLGYAGAPGSGSIRNSRSRLSILSLNGLLGAPRAWRSEEQNQTLNDTRSGLRFLAKRREEVEEADYDLNASFAPHARHPNEVDEYGEDEGEWEDDMGGRKRFVGSLPSQHSMPPMTSLSTEHSMPQIEGFPEPPPRQPRWNIFKWVLFISTIVIFVYGTAGLVASLLTWSRSWGHAEVTVVADTDILIFITLASFLCVLTSVVGLCGAILNNRPILALYAFLLWPTFISMMVVGYSSYKRANLRLDRKLNMAWSRYYTDLDRLRLQNNLHCCGFYSPLHEATFSRSCYPRTTLPGCKGKLFRYERASLQKIYQIVFTLVFIHLAAILSSLLCANHVNEQFGKGLTPRAYRLDMGHVRRNAVNIMRALIESSNEAADKDDKLAGEDDGQKGMMMMDEKRGWDVNEDTPVSSVHGHGEKAEMGYGADLGYGTVPHDPRGVDTIHTYSFPPRPQEPSAMPTVMHPEGLRQEGPVPNMAEVGSGGIRIISYRGGHPPGGELHEQQGVEMGPTGEVISEWGHRGHVSGGPDGTIRGLGFTMAVPANAAASLSDRKLGELA